MGDAAPDPRTIDTAVGPHERPTLSARADALEVELRATRVILTELVDELRRDADRLAEGAVFGRGDGAMANVLANRLDDGAARLRSRAGQLATWLGRGSLCSR